MMDVAAAVRRTLDGAADGKAIEFEGRWMTWGDVRGLAAAVETTLAARGVEPTHAIGFIARNRGTHAAILAGLIADRRPIAMIYAFQSPTALARDISTLGLIAVIASDDDWTPETSAAAAAAGSIRIVLDVPSAYGIVVDGGRRTADHRRLPEPGIEILSSGTTGPPKRIFHRSEVLFRSLAGGIAGVTAQARSPDLVFWPIGGIGGTLQATKAFLTGRPLVVLERFTVAGVVEAVSRFALPTIGLTPTMARMIHDADVSRDEFASLVGLYGGGGPLDPDLQDRLEERYGIPVYWAMGATEFCGTIIAWTPDLRAAFGTTKRGSTGRAIAGCELRVRDPETDADVSPGRVGRLDVRVAAIGPEWVATTDLVAIDEDGFVFHHGRSDGAIIRGGFKILPERLNEVLRLHPGVEDAAVVGLPDDRLGAVPVAAVVRRPGHEALDEPTLTAFARSRLPTPQVPVRFHFLAALPQTASTKVDIVRLKAMLGSS